jgi:hypothetical protein
LEFIQRFTIQSAPIVAFVTIVESSVAFIMKKDADHKRENFNNSSIWLLSTITSLVVVASNALAIALLTTLANRTLALPLT